MQFDFFSINNVPNHFYIVWKDCVQIILSYGLIFFMQLVAYICWQANLWAIALKAELFCI